MNVWSQQPQDLTEDLMRSVSDKKKKFNKSVRLFLNIIFNCYVTSPEPQPHPLFRTIRLDQNPLGL
jgi:hypothetical protein